MQEAPPIVAPLKDQEPPSPYSFYSCMHDGGDPARSRNAGLFLWPLSASRQVVSLPHCAPPDAARARAQQLCTGLTLSAPLTASPGDAVHEITARGDQLTRWSAPGLETWSLAPS